MYTLFDFTEKEQDLLNMAGEKIKELDTRLNGTNNSGIIDLLRCIQESCREAKRQITIIAFKLFYKKTFSLLEYQILIDKLCSKNGCVDWKSANIYEQEEEFDSVCKQHLLKLDLPVIQGYQPHSIEDKIVSYLTLLENPDRLYHKKLDAMSTVYKPATLIHQRYFTITPKSCYKLVLEKYQTQKIKGYFLTHEIAAICKVEDNDEELYGVNLASLIDYIETKEVEDDESAYYKVTINQKEKRNEFELVIELKQLPFITSL